MKQQHIDLAIRYLERKKLALEDMLRFHEVPSQRKELALINETIEALRAQAQQLDANGLLPCPFCGEEAELHDYSTETDSWVVMCKGACYAEMHSRQSPQAAIHLWNRRAPTPQPVPDEVRQAIGKIDAFHNEAYSLVLYGEMIDEISVLCTWLAQQPTP